MTDPSTTTYRICNDCGHPAAETDTVCRIDGGLLIPMSAPATTAVEPTTTQGVPMDEPRPPENVDPQPTVVCRECRTAVDPSADRCPNCLATLARATIAIRIMFQPDQYVITLRRGERIVLGRDPELSPHAAYLSRFPNVSRRHASLSLDNDGRASIRDEYSTNWTLHRSERLTPGHERELGDGDRIRLGASLSGEVRLLAHEPPPGPEPTRSDR
ncbi:hypothetical protein Q0Z83_045490 [Actinoplanes sichuanensis]|uniref:FHA domain-containing protein n=1 Tax=Actinoplanes sichuanensis TaxID=512349 RepID=A0ABW4A905_9ACTN|nr:FHA domain-containing protein [Actinoplanes sichuanensis]BEL06358.1 hypothetical protein Q0Z83_045490 [Actinoplanes sichuanensis]